MGEPILQMQVIRSLDRDEPDTVITLARQTLLAVMDNGGLLWTKRLEFSPRCLLAHGSMGPTAPFTGRAIGHCQTWTLLFLQRVCTRFAQSLAGKQRRFSRHGINLKLAVKDLPILDLWISWNNNYWIKCHRASFKRIVCVVFVHICFLFNSN